MQDPNDPKEGDRKAAGPPVSYWKLLRWGWVCTVHIHIHCTCLAYNDCTACTRECVQYLQGQSLTLRALRLPMPTSVCFHSTADGWDWSAMIAGTLTAIVNGECDQAFADVQEMRQNNR